MVSAKFITMIFVSPLLPYITAEKGQRSMNVFGKMEKGISSDTEDTEGSETHIAMKGMAGKRTKGDKIKTKDMEVKKDKVNKTEKRGDGKKDDKLTLRVMSYNIWGGGANEGKPVNETVNVILAANADIVGVQETRLESDPCTAESCPATGDSVVGTIADALGFYYYDQTTSNAALWANGIISRYPIKNATKNDLGVPIDVNGDIVYAFNLHFTDYPYQPYQVLNITYGNASFLQTEEELIVAAEEARGPALDLFFEDMEEATDAVASFVFGDFNEPSFRDWNKDAVEASQQPLKVRWPTTLAFEQAGYIDAYREIYPNVVQKPAFTWTPTTNVTDPEDKHDRIDFVFAKADRIRVTDAAIVGEMSPEADIVVTPWPSDHRAVVAEIEIGL